MKCRCACRHSAIRWSMIILVYFGIFGKSLLGRVWNYLTVRDLIDWKRFSQHIVEVYHGTSSAYCSVLFGLYTYLAFPCSSEGLLLGRKEDCCSGNNDWSCFWTWGRVLGLLLLCQLILYELLDCCHNGLGGDVALRRSLCLLDYYRSFCDGLELTIGGFNQSGQWGFLLRAGFECACWPLLRVLNWLYTCLAFFVPKKLSPWKR